MSKVFSITKKLSVKAGLNSGNLNKDIQSDPQTLQNTIPIASNKAEPLSSKPFRNNGNVRTEESSLYASPILPRTPTMSTFGSSTSLRSPNPSTRGPSSSPPSKLIKQLLKKYKKLEISLTRFNSKSNSRTKTNILRLTLLPFLRHSNEFNDLSKYTDSNICGSLNNVLLTVLIKWWEALLCGLLDKVPPSTATSSLSCSPNSQQSSEPSMKTKLPNIPESQHHFMPAPHSQVGSSDRNAYLEGISRIIARREWFALHKKLDKDLIHQFEYLLETTLDCCVYKLQNYKQVPLSLLSFIGKVFAYLFFHIPEVAKALMFLLGTKLSQLDGVKKCFLKEEDEEVHDDEESCQSKSDMMKKIFTEAFPPHLHEFIDFKGNRANTQLTRGQRTLINAVPPPKHPVRGIKDPNGIWVKRWNSYDSDIFCSFLRHYLSIVEDLIGKENSLGYQTLVRYCPGLSIVTAHILQNIKNVVYNRPMLSSPMIPANISMDPSGTTKASPLPPTPTRGSNGNASQNGATANENQGNNKYSSLIKIFNVLRDSLYHSNTVLREFIHIIDGILISEAKSISVYDVNKASPVFNLVYEFANHIDGNPFGYDLNWTFWLDCNYRMLNCTDHIQLMLKSLSFIFNSWDLIPVGFNFSPVPNINEPYDNNDDSYPWILFAEYGDKLNFSRWLICQETFEKFFIHWHPIVRSYYIRFLVWRLIGVNNLENTVQIDLISELNSVLTTGFNVLVEHLECLALTGASYSSLSALDFKVDSPLANRRLSVMAIRDEFLDLECFHDLRKTHPFEIFDEAVYTCLALTVNPLVNVNNSLNSVEASAGSLISKNERSNGLVSSLGKFLKGLTVKDEEELSRSSQDYLSQHPPSSSTNSSGTRSTSLGSMGIDSKFGSFSTLILRSPSPSLFSFNLDPTSLSLFSSEDDDESDMDKVSSSLDEIFAYGEEESYGVTCGDSVHSTPKSSQSRRDTTPASRAYSSRKTIFKSPPDVIRPIYKIDIVIDHDSFNDKLRIVNNSVRGGYPWVISLRNQCELPPEPTIPNMSIFITNDPFNKFLIQEEYMIFSNQPDDDQNCQKKKAFESKLNMNVINNLGKSLFEYHKVVEEFKFFLSKRVEFDHLNSLPTFASNSATNRDVDSGVPSSGNGFQGFADGSSLDEATYLRRIMPNLCIDTEMGFANAG